MEQEQYGSLSRLSDRSFVNHLLLNTDLYREEFNNVIEGFHAYDILVVTHNSGILSPKLRKELTRAYRMLKDKHFKRNF